MEKKKIVVGITGASGALYAKVLLDKLITVQDQLATCAVIFSTNAVRVWEYELGPLDTSHLPFRLYTPFDLFAPPASGSAGYDSMIICPCSMGTLGRIASGVSTDLMTRAADVMLKEHRKLILVPRETPYSLIHLRNMELLASAGAVILPASPSFYSHPKTMEDLVSTVVDRILVTAGFGISSYRWREDLD
jgi:4-hydroxy-3-polyprenylbenzoate decarboxylase